MKTLTLLLFLSLLNLTACTTTSILSSNFETQTIGNLPAKNLPGNPSGDSLRYQAVLEPRLRVQASATSGEKALHFTQVAPAGELTAFNQWLSFRGVSTNFVEPLWFIWAGDLLNNGFADYTVYVTDGRGGIICGLIYGATGNVSLLASRGGAEVIGNLPAGMRHTVIVSLNPASSSYNLTIFPKTGIRIEALNKTVFVGSMLSYANPARPSVDMRFSDGTMNTNRFVIESVSITRKQPD
ncbi:MAG: hypothetical protein LH609_23370 [Rudanella sp.]|nr:hypothetical protein [Rudanella sp.]